MVLGLLRFSMSPKLELGTQKIQFRIPVNRNMLSLRPNPPRRTVCALNLKNLATLHIK